MLVLRGMRALLPFLACLMLVLTGWASMSHAAEAAGGSFAGITFELHAAGDGDEMPADGDTDAPHHHSVCHGHDVGHPARTADPRLHAIAGTVGSALPLRVLVAADQQIALRPPKA